jgi:hypothetical protein
MPGSCLANEEILTLTKDDAVVMRGGSNHVNKNETSNGLKRLKDFTIQRSNTNIIALVAPTGHGLQETSCIGSTNRARLAGDSMH